MGGLDSPPSVVLLAGDGALSNAVFNALRRRFSIARVIFEEGVPRRELLRRRARKLGLQRVIGQLAFRAGAVPFLHLTSRQRIREICEEFSLDLTPPPAQVVSRVTSANAPETVALLQEIRPAAVVVNGTRILGADILARVQSVFLNTHVGITPSYRGVHGGYWALTDRRADLCGVTVHLIDRGIDTGGVLGQALIHPTAADNFTTYPYLQIAAALPLLRQALAAAITGRAETVSPLASSSRLWSHPTLVEYLYHWATKGVR